MASQSIQFRNKPLIQSTESFTVYNNNNNNNTISPSLQDKDPSPVSESTNLIKKGKKSSSNNITLPKMTLNDLKGSNVSSFLTRLLKRKNLDDILNPDNLNHFHRTLGWFDLTMLGIGGIIGTGIFVLTGTVAAKFAGPAITISFLIAGFAAALAALCYSEMASMIPIAGSAYTYAYATMGELVAWTIGWDLLLEYLVGSATVAVGLSGYIVSLIETIPYFECEEACKAWTNAPFQFDAETQSFSLSGHFINLPAVICVLAPTFLLITGIKESSKFNNFAVIVKVLIIIIFIFAAIPFVNTDNWKPFIPPNKGTFGSHGISGIFQGATTVFFAYIGFDAVSTTAMECKNPQRDLPIGILVSLTVCTILYIAVSFLLTGLVPYTQLNVAEPIAVGVEATGMVWLQILVAIAAIAGLTSVLLVNLMSQPRILFSMAEDGLLPKVFSKVSRKYKTPAVSTTISGVICAILAGLLPIDVLGELTSVGTLFAFALVSIGVMILRLRHPEQPRGFTVPFGPYLIPISSSLLSLGLISTATLQTIVRLFGWMAIGFIFYFSYGYRNSILNRSARDSPTVQDEKDESIQLESIEF